MYSPCLAHVLKEKHHLLNKKLKRPATPLYTTQRIRVADGVSD